MTHTLSYLLEIVGLVLLVIGYRKANRNLMLAAALLLWFGGSFDGFVQGFLNGVQPPQRT
jgi:hypothetical protein